MHLKRLAFPALVLTALTVTAASAQTASTTATRSLTFPPTGLASSETAQLNVVNIASASSSGTAASCTGTLSFVNASGTVIGTATAFTVTTGQISSASILFTRVGVTGLRAEVRGVVTLTITSGSNVPCNLVSTLETYDTATGATHIHLGAGNLEGGNSRH